MFFSGRTYARGGGMHRMDPEEAAERERRKKQAEETQRIIQQQVILLWLFQYINIERFGILGTVTCHSSMKEK